jgi:hypothetical protein
MESIADSVRASEHTQLSDAWARADDDRTNVQVLIAPHCLDEVPPNAAAELREPREVALHANGEGVVEAQLSAERVDFNGSKERQIDTVRYDRHAVIARVHQLGSMV